MTLQDRIEFLEDQNKLLTKTCEGLMNENSELKTKLELNRTYGHYGLTANIRIGELEKENSEIKEANKGLGVTIKNLEDDFASLEKENVDLKDRLNKTVDIANHRGDVLSNLIDYIRSNLLMEDD